MEIPLFTSKIFGDELKLSFGNEQINQSPHLHKENFIAILTNIVKGNMKEDLKDIKMLLHSSKEVEDFNLNIDDFSDIMGDLYMSLHETLRIDDEDLKTINAVISAILNALNSAINNIENNHKVILKINETKQNLLSVDLTEDLDIDLMQPAIKNPNVIAQKTNLLIYNDSKGSNADIEKIINKLSERNINQIIPKISNYDLTENIKAIPKVETKELLNKDNNLSSISVLNHSFEKDADILKYSFNEHSSQNQNNSNEMKHTSKEIPFSHSGQTFSDSLDKNLQIDSSIQKIKVINHEGQDINETNIYFSKLDNSTLRLEIKTEGIGLCDIELTLEKGVLNAQILASEAAGKNFFDNNLSNIINNLLREGLNVGKFSVSLGDRKGEANDEKGGDKQKAAKLIEKVNILDNYYKNSLISIFI